MRQRIRAILDWAITQGYRSDNAAGPAIHGVLPKRRSRENQKQHHCAVPYGEVPQVVIAVRRMHARAPLRLLFEFAVLTAVRSGEAREAQWSELDFDSATWVIPASRMKIGFPHRVPLSDRVLEILREMREENTGTGLVFPGKKPGRPFSDSALLGLLRRLHLEGTVHGFRSSFRDWVAEQNAGTAEAAECALAHARTNSDRGGVLAHRFARGAPFAHATLGQPRHFADLCMTLWLGDPCRSRSQAAVHDQWCQISELLRRFCNWLRRRLFGDELAGWSPVCGLRRGLGAALLVSQSAVPWARSWPSWLHAPLCCLA